MTLFEERKRLEQEDGEPLHTLRVTPDFDAAAACNGAGVVVVAGEWGVTPEVEQRLVTPLAEAGFFVVAIDLVRGQPGRTASEARARAATIEPETALADIAAALLYLKELASGRLGVIGFDAAGGLVLEAATVLPQIDAVVHAGGGAPRKGTRLARTRSSFLILRGTRTSPLAKETCADLLERVRPSGNTVIVRDHDAPDGFMVRPLDDEEREHAVEAWDQTRDFLQQTLI